MKRVTLQLHCDAADCTKASMTANGPTLATARRLARDEGWRLGVVRDICPSCARKGHRP